MRARVRRKPKVVSITPLPSFADGLESANVFRDKFHALGDEEWFDVLVNAMSTETIADVRFPQYPPAELQNRIHGYSSTHALREAFDFYEFIKSHDDISRKFNSDSYFLDFAAGWGRMSRPFLRDFDLSKIFAYEPNRAFCVIARSLNPYICFLNGDYYPDYTLPQNRFDLVIGYSIFTHLSPHAAMTWLTEMARITRPDGYCVFTAWGNRFLDRLIDDNKSLGEGKEIHWYSRSCLSAAGDILDVQRRYQDGEFVWFTAYPGGHYGESFLPPRALSSLLADHDIPFEVVEFDQDKLAQDAFILRRRPNETAVRLVHSAPASVDQLARNGWAAVSRRDWQQAATLWEAVRAKAPDRADGYIAGSHALRELGQLDEAEALGLEAITRFPDSPDALTASAWVATTRQDWDEALRRWQVARERFPDRPDVYIWGGLALRQARRFDEAEVVSSEAVARFPDNVDGLIQHAWSATERGDWDAALLRWQAVRERRPDEEDAHVRPILALRASRRLEEADAAAAEALARFPQNRTALIEQILTAADRGDWQRVSTYMAVSRERLLVDGRIDPALNWVDYRLRLSASAPVAAAETSEAIAEAGNLSSYRDLMLSFESLGERCDFGAVQKYCGAEPLGLLRFANVPIDRLIAALDDRFAAIGTVEDTMFLPHTGEYMINTRRYAITSHTYVMTKDLPTEKSRERFFAKQRQRLSFLRDKLIADLENAEKTFVYASFVQQPDAEIDRLFGAMRNYGDIRLLCVQPADANHPDGSVGISREGLLVGYIQRFADFPGGEQPPVGSWLALCRNASRLLAARGADKPDPGSPVVSASSPAEHRQATPLTPAQAATFCVRPWNHFRIEANGAARVCCLYEGDTVARDGQLMSSKNHSLMELWNSDTMREVRRDMVEGRRVAGCRQCYTVEDRGGLSTRAQDNSRWEAGWLNPGGAKLEELAALAIGNDFSLPMPPVQLEVEVGNLCNFKCRMCHGTASSRIGKDEVHQSWAEDSFSATHHDPTTKPGPYKFHRATSIAKLGAELAADKEGRIKRLYFTGGEPMLVREVGEVIEMLVAAGRAPDIELAFVSNGSVLPSWAPLAEHFRRVDMTISVDGFGSHHEYIRYPGRWTVLVEHLEALRRYPNIELAISTTVQVNNALNLTQLFRYLDLVGIPSSAYLLHWPKYLSVSVLPPSVRRVGAERLREYAGNDCPPWRRELVLSLAAQFGAGDDTVDPVLIRDLMLFTNDLDATRGQNIHQRDPELVGLLAKAGFPWTNERLHAVASR